MASMSEPHNPWPESLPPGSPPLTVVPVHATPAPRSSPVLGLLRWFFRMAFALSVGVNLSSTPATHFQRGSCHTAAALNTRFYPGNRNAKSKISIVKIDGVIIEGMIGYARRQIHHAQEDDHVKAVVVRIDSPGGTIT